MTALILAAEVVAQYTAALERFQSELIIRWKTSDTEARQALYLMLIQGPHGHVHVVLGEHVPAVTHIARKVGMQVIPVQADGHNGIALPPLTSAIREAWPGPIMF